MSSLKLNGLNIHFHSGKAIIFLVGFFFCGVSMSGLAQTELDTESGAGGQEGEVLDIGIQNDSPTSVSSPSPTSANSNSYNTQELSHSSPRLKEVSQSPSNRPSGGVKSVDKSSNLAPVDSSTSSPSQPSSSNSLTSGATLDRQNYEDKLRVRDGVITTPQGGIVILNQSSPSPVVQQPTTYVEANSTPESRTEEYRRARQDAELNTEKRIFEKLEESRLQDEKRRLERIMGGVGLGGAATELSPNGNPKSPNPANLQSVQVIGEEGNRFDSTNPSANGQSGIENKRSGDLRSMDKQNKLIEDEVQGAEAGGAIDGTGSAKDPATDKNSRHYYMSGTVGSASYEGVSNVQGNIAAGASFGALLNNGLSMEVSFLYSNFYIDEYWWNYPYFKEMDQYSLGVGAKYNFNFGIVKPSIGGLVAYTYRRYFDRGYYSYTYSDDSEVSSHAVDLGLTAGVDLEFTEQFSVGVEYRYMTNLASKTDSEYLTSRSIWREGQPVEKTDYSVVGLVGKFHF